MPADHADPLSLSDSELDLLMGNALTADEFGAMDLTDAEKRAQARNWFAARLAEFGQVVCRNGAVQKYVNQKDSIEREVFDAIASALASMTGLPVPVGVLAAKLVRYGLTNLCEVPAARSG